MPAEPTLTTAHAPALARDAPQTQQAHVHVLHSNERTGLTPVFGTSVPPSGLSGRLRTWAFRYSEGDLRHWLMLLFADRINVAEGLLDDLSRGKVPNPWSEMGLASEWRHRRRPLVLKLLAGSALLGLAVYGLRRRGQRLGR